MFLSINEKILFLQIYLVKVKLKRHWFHVVQDFCRYELFYSCVNVLVYQNDKTRDNVVL